MPEIGWTIEQVQGSINMLESQKATTEERIKSLAEDIAEKTSNRAFVNSCVENLVRENAELQRIVGRLETWIPVLNAMRE